MHWKDRKVIVLGLGDSGLSMVRWLASHAARVSVADTREQPPHLKTLKAEHPEIEVACGEWSAAVFEKADAIAISPGLDRREPLVVDAQRRGVPVIGDVELFAQALPEVARQSGAARPKIVAITGSNGKSTVTAMAGEACRAAGRETLVAGNIGLPVLDALRETAVGAPFPEIVVLELSSFQLESTYTLAPDAATVLNVTEDHLDRYADMAEYAAAKARIFEGARARVVNREDRWSMSMAGDGDAAVTFGLDAPRRARDWGLAGDALTRGDCAVMPLGDLPVSGLHNAANALAALALGAEVGLEHETMAEGLRRFRGLPHRLQKVAEARGVTFYDDSKGTNVGATVAALNGLSGAVVLIAGGDGKGQDFSPLARAVASKARTVVLIGRDAEVIAKALEPSGVRLVRADTLENATEIAFDAARPDSAVLLSPACASYDMFRNYVHRGQMFAAAARAIAEREGVHT